MAKVRWLVLPLTAFFLFLGGGAVVAPECHVGQKSNNVYLQNQSHFHADPQIIHTHSVSQVPVSLIQRADSPNNNSLNSEFCFAFGFLVLVLLQFYRLKKTPARPSGVKARMSSLKFHHIKSAYFPSLTHLELGIIRI